jgi:dTDP-4-dehydrorhamnose reductase
MKVVVLGGNGQLGMDVVTVFKGQGDTVVALTHNECEICSLERTREVLRIIQPDVIVNTAAMHHVERCEEAPQKAYEVNAIGARNVAIVARELESKLIHISTDYVFNGLKKQPYVETDAALPLNVYGSTKYSGELFVQNIAEKYFILRTSALYGRHPCRAKGGSNFVDLMLRLGSERGHVRVVDDEIVSPTPTAALARQIAILATTDRYGLYHATAEGSCSWYQFASTIFEMTSTKVRLEVANANEFPSKAPRPKYSVLENDALKKLGISCLPAWREGLLEYLSERTTPVGFN